MKGLTTFSAGVHLCKLLDSYESTESYRFHPTFVAPVNMRRRAEKIN